MQGLQYDEILMVLHDNHSPKLKHRKLFYTGFTRHRKKLTILGASKAIKQCIDNEDKMDRRTYFMSRIRKHMCLEK